MTKSFPVKKKSRAETRAPKLLASVPYDRGFHFFTAVGHYTIETATSLVNLLEELQVIEVDPVTFHFRRKDFQKWIGNVMGDKELPENEIQPYKELWQEFEPSPFWVWAPSGPLFTQTSNQIQKATENREMTEAFSFPLRSRL